MHIFLFVEEIVELTRGHHTCLAAVIDYSENLKDIHKILVVFLHVILDRAHLLKEAVKVADKAAACGALDVRVHCA